MANNMGEYDDSIKYAADVNFDDSVSDADSVTVAGYAIGNDVISQIR